MGSKDEIVNKLLFTTSGDEYKDHINFCAYRTKLLAVARAKKINKAILLNKKPDGTTNASPEELADAWSLIVRNDSSHGHSTHAPTRALTCPHDRMCTLMYCSSR